MKFAFQFDLLFDQFKRVLVPWAIILVFVAQVVFALASLSAMLFPLVESPHRTVEQKMRVQLGPYMDLVYFIQDKTPDHAVVLFGPQWIRNPIIYFLYPRTLYYGDEEALRLHPDVEYVVIDGEYPSFPVDGETIMLDSQRGLYRVKR